MPPDNKGYYLLQMLQEFYFVGSSFTYCFFCFFHEFYHRERERLIWTQIRTQQKKKKIRLGHMAQFVSWNPNSLRRDCSAANNNREVAAENKIAPANLHGHCDSATKRSQFCRDSKHAPHHCYRVGSCMKLKRNLWFMRFWNNTSNSYPKTIWHLIRIIGSPNCIASQYLLPCY